MTPAPEFWPTFHDFRIVVLDSLKENERITGLGVFLSVKRRRLRASIGVRQIPAEGEEEKRRRKEEEKKTISKKQ